MAARPPTIDEAIAILEGRGFQVRFARQQPLTYEIIDARGGLALREAQDVIWFAQTECDPYKWLTA